MDFYETQNVCEIEDSHDLIRLLKTLGGKIQGGGDSQNCTIQAYGSISGILKTNTL